jgi:hypothetical protein
MTIFDVLAGSAARREQSAMDDTWGHLRGNPRRTYRGEVVWAVSEYGGESMIISADLGDLPDSPWLLDALCDLLHENVADGPDAGVYRWTGTYRVRHGFTGSVERVELRDPSV